MGTLDPLGAGPWVRAFLGMHVARLRVALADKDRGASAIELAVITAFMIVVALGILFVIKQFVIKTGNNIKNQQVP